MRMVEARHEVASAVLLAEDTRTRTKWFRFWLQGTMYLIIMCWSPLRRAGARGNAEGDVHAEGDKGVGTELGAVVMYDSRRRRIP